MLLYYHKDPLGNFGDDLNPWLFNRLLPGMFDGEVAHDPAKRGQIDDDSTLFVGIGTLLNDRVPARPHKIVFASGAGYGATPAVDARWRFSCVRGPLTCRMLGLEPSMAVTDGAVLVRTIVDGPHPDARDVAYMPHCSTARNVDCADICERAGLVYIDPQRAVDDVLDAIRRSQVLITEALHGAIVADALRIPWMPVAGESAILSVKWQDWCQSLGFEYRPTKLPTLWGTGRQPTLAGRLRLAAKTAMAVATLRRLKRKGRPGMSADAALDRATDELRERLARLRP
jgi:succinoglycan biosynthesis protein ExoV